MYRNVWSRLETARYMAWQITTDEEQAIGFAGVKEIKPHIYEDTSIALGPEYAGKGYGKQILPMLLAYCCSLGGEEFYYSTRSGNEAFKGLARSCGFAFQWVEEKTDWRDGEPYQMKVYYKALEKMQMDDI